MFDSLMCSFGAEGKRIASCRAARAKEVQQKIQALLDEGIMDRRVHAAYFGAMRFDPPASYGSDASLLVIATPHSRSILVLDLPGGLVEAAIPSTYLADRVASRNSELLAEVLNPLGRRFEPARLPLKTLAACTGLGAYGKDNVIRVQGMGSFARLDAFWIDSDLGEGSWGPPEILPRCASCGSACLRVCPNACFRDGVFPVDASRCLTFLNESDGELPRWLPAGAHSAAIGCLRCQEACPENAKHRRAVERRLVFDRRTSEALLEGRSVDSLPSDAARLIRLLELEGKEKRLARNLSVLLHARS